MKMTSDEIKAARKEGFVLANFGEGFLPAIWSPGTWVVAEPRENQHWPGKRLRSRWFSTYPISIKTSPMLAWMPIPTIESIERNRQIIKQLVDALESARGYVHETSEDAILLRKDVMQDLENIDTALSSGHAFLGTEPEGLGE